MDSLQTTKGVMSKCCCVSFRGNVVWLLKRKWLRTRVGTLIVAAIYLQLIQN